MTASLTFDSAVDRQAARRRLYMAMMGITEKRTTMKKVEGEVLPYSQ
jgi:hypothetical protein